jgi:hypothetical protein
VSESWNLVEDIEKLAGVYVYDVACFSDDDDDDYDDDDDNNNNNNN